MEGKISVHSLKKNFGELEVLKDVSIEMRKGGVVYMIGPSGSDKGTLLRCLSHLEKVTSGHVMVNGRPISDPNTNINKVRENIGMMLQHFDLFPHLTVKENVTLAPAELKLTGKEKVGRKALELLARVGLADKAEAYPGQLSGGQKQRVTIARSLTMSPNIMLFDELMLVLDPEMVGEVPEVMRQLAADGMTMVAVTHEMGFARGVADRIVFMDGGYIVKEGTPDGVFENPRGERARSFLDKVLQTSGLLGG